MENENKKILKAKAQLILDQPFFASLLLSMPMIQDESVGTFATDGDKILYSDKFVNTLTVDEIVFVLAHEVMHCAFHHMFRIGSKDAPNWNIATDYVINEILVNDHVGAMPKMGLLNSELVKKANGLAEKVYQMLPKQKQGKDGDSDKQGKSGKGKKGKSKSSGNGNGKGNQPQGFDKLIPNNCDQATTNQKIAEMKIKISQAANAAKMCGKLGANLKRFVGNAVKSNTDWKAVLRNFFVRAKTDLSYAKPKRRFLAEDIYLPSLVGEAMGKIVIAIDCSGSIDMPLLTKFIAEINMIKQDTRPVSIEVLYFDTEVNKHDSYLPDDNIKAEAVGGGGTAFSPVFDYIYEKDIQPMVAVFFTDLICNDFGLCPDFPVLWASSKNDYTKVPFGEVLEIKEFD